MNSMLQHNSVLTLSPQQQHTLAASGKGRELLEIFRKQALMPLFQPIIDLKQRCIFAHEALIRGPKNSYLHSPLNLLQVAEEHGCLFEIDWLARLLSIHSFRHQRSPSLLFLNVTVNTIMQKTHRSGITLEYLQLLCIPVEQVVIEITELQPVEDFQAFIESVNHYRNMGFKVAVDDLGAGYNGLRIWSELRPDFVKIDHHFVSGIDSDNDKYHFMETLCQLARQLDTCIIAEGVERIEELQSLEVLGVDYVQGFLLQRPQETISGQLDFDWNLLRPQTACRDGFPVVDCLRQQAFVITRDFNLMQVARFYFANPDIEFSPVVINERICGMIWRDQLMMHIARSLEYNSNPNHHISALIDSEALIIAADTGLYDVARILTCANGRQRNQAFIITEHGHYSGCATMADLLEKIVQLKA